MKFLDRGSRAALLFALGLYQAGLRPLLAGGCKHYPSCSEYAREAVARYGAWRGARLSLARLLRCRPGAFGGYDPVPATPPRDP